MLGCDISNVETREGDSEMLVRPPLLAPVTPFPMEDLRDP